MQLLGPGSLLLGLLLLLSCCWECHSMDWQWRTGRVTHYGGSGDPWSIHHGSCGYKYLDPTVNKGWDVAALADAVGDYHDSCGRCYEIGCAPMHLKDGYGTGLDRTHVCYDTSQTLVLMITDTCPCNYPPNAYSNKRWCCGDYFHMDVSAWSFERLADKKYGVIGIRYREVPCDYCPDNPARVPNGGSPSQATEGAPGGWQPSWDKRPHAKMCFKSSLDGQSGGGGDGGNGGNGGNGDNKQGTNSNQGGGGGNNHNNKQGSSNGRQLFPSNSFLFPSNSLLKDWHLASNSMASMSPWTAPNGQSAFCGTLKGYASLVFKSSNGGSLIGKRQLGIDLKTQNGQVPDYILNLSSSSKGTCRSIDLRSCQGERNGDWIHLSVPLVNANWFSQWSDSASVDFTGCSNSIGAWDVDQLEFKNKWGGDQGLCLSNVKAT